MSPESRQTLSRSMRASLGHRRKRMETHWISIPRLDESLTDWLCRTVKPSSDRQELDEVQRCYAHYRQRWLNILGEFSRWPQWLASFRRDVMYSARQSLLVLRLPAHEADEIARACVDAPVVGWASAHHGRPATGNYSRSASPRLCGESE